MPSDRVLPLRLLLPVIQVENTAIGCKAGTPALGKISGLGSGGGREGGGRAVMRRLLCLSIHSLKLSKDSSTPQQIQLIRR